MDYAEAGYKGPFIAGVVIEELFGNNNQISILDCGSGTGLAGEQLRSRGFSDIVGVDLSEKSLEIAKKKNVYTELFKCAVGKDTLPFDNDAFDALFSCGSMGPTHIQPDALPDIIRVVKQGGYVVVIVRKTHAGGNSAIIQRFEEEFRAMVNTLQSSEKISLVEERIIPGYVERKPGVLHIFKVLQKSRVL